MSGRLASPGRQSVVRLIRALQEGRLAGSGLGGSDRRRVVEHLMAEGYSSVEIAEIVGVSERTVERDRAAIRSSHALELTPEFVGQTIGHLVRQAEIAVGRLRRLGRDKGSPAAARVDAEYAAWRVQRDLIAALQRLGCLPDVGVSVDVRASVTHRFGVGVGLGVGLGGGAGALDPLEAAPALEALEAELARLERVQADTGGVPGPVLAQIDAQRRAIARLAVAARLTAIEQAPALPAGAGAGAGAGA